MQLPGQRQPVREALPQERDQRETVSGNRPGTSAGPVRGSAHHQTGCETIQRACKAISIETGPPRWPHGFGWERARLLRHFRQQFAFCRRAAQPEKQKEEAQKKSNAGNANKKVHGFYTLMLMILRMISTPMVIIPRPA